MRFLGAFLILAACAGAPESRENAVMERTAAAYIAADYDAVWEKLTTAGEFASWYSMGGIAFPHEKGAELEWGPPGQVTIRGTLRWIEKGKGFGHTFQFRGLGFDEPETDVEWEVVQQGPVVLVRVVHRAPESPETMAMIGDLGWAKTLNRLKTLLETGEPMPWPSD